MFSADRLIFRTSGNLHPDVQVRERGKVRYLRFGRWGGWQGAVRLDGHDRPVFAYQRAFTSLLDAVTEPSSFLSVGVGTGTCLHHVHTRFPRCELVGVEADEAVIEVAIAFFDSPPPGLAQYFACDGVAYVQRCPQTFDLVFVDAYLSQAIYDPCLDPEFAWALAELCGSKGSVAFNWIGRWPLRDRQRLFAQAACERFAHAAVLPVGWGPATLEQNMLAVFTHDPALVSRWQAALRNSQALLAHERWIWPHRLKRLC
ncbi:MAG: spermidine synthase [Alicyclobacillus sp.]|nr:spermidine synthase [Alicyclobacillus sp.]